MEAKPISVVIFEKTYQGIRDGFPAADLPKDLQPTDFIRFEHEEADYSENSSSNSESILKVYRTRMETEEEFQKRKEFYMKKAEESRAERHRLYLKYKEEFEQKK